MRLRPATIIDLPDIMHIISCAVERMLAEGKCQWDYTYPTATHIITDIHADAAYVLENDGKIIAYGAVLFTGEPAYSAIDGLWLSDAPYVVVHRLAVAPEMQGNGIAAKFIKSVEHLAASKGFSSFKIDTNFDNHRMLRTLEKCGFCHCGEIHYPQGSRLAFEKLI